MRIFEISPGEKEEIEDAKTKIYQILTTECSQSLRAFLNTGKFLYRGYTYVQHNAFKGMSRTDRRPLSFDKERGQKIDDMYNDLGLVPRSKSIFCTSTYSDAAFYTSYTVSPGTQAPGEKGGDKNVYYIFPVNGFKFTWCKNANDLFGEWSPFDDEMIDNMQYHDIAEKYGLNNNNFTEAVNSGHEVAINGTYYAFKVDMYTPVINLICNKLKGGQPL